MVCIERLNPSKRTALRLPVLYLFVAFGVGWGGAAQLRGQGGPLYINEILAANNSQGPTDIGGEHTDMIEIYNAGDEVIILGSNNPVSSYYLSASTACVSDTEELNCDLSVPEDFDPRRVWRFPALVEILPGGYLTIFNDDDPFENLCELHSNFRLDNNGTQRVTLWGPEGADGVRPLLDQIWLPPLRPDVSFGRYPDGAGPAPMPLAETRQHMRFNPGEGFTTFGECIDIGIPCPGQNTHRICSGASNEGGANLEPYVSQLSYTSATPDAGESVALRARVEDDDLPLPVSQGGTITRVQIRYSVDEVEQPPLDMVYDEVTGLLDGTGKIPPQPLERWTEWTGTLPGQTAGSVVRYEFFVEDQEGLSSTDPQVQCPSGTGPCDEVGLPGTGCVCDEEIVIDQETYCLRYVECDHRLQYVAGYVRPAELEGLLINEIVAEQNEILKDTERPGDCPDENPECKFGDFIELYNGSAGVIVLAGMWLSNRPFHPQGYQFPDGSVIQPGEYLIVWCEASGGRCPRSKILGDTQECPDQTNPSRGRYHTDFTLDQTGDQIYLFQEVRDVNPDEVRGYGAVHFHEFGPQPPNTALSLIPDGTRGGQFQLTQPTPRAENVSASLSFFLRGDTNSDCKLNITDATFLLNFLFLGGPPPPCPDAADSRDDGSLSLTSAVYLLNFLFLGGPRPPEPGPSVPGPDPTGDELGSCREPACLPPRD